MKKLKILRIALTFGALIFLSACGRVVFETDADAQARKALQNLMEIQNAYHKEHNTYAHNMLEIQKYNLKYHQGIVYLEIESASKDKYRAVSLPAESTTARVFAFDTDKGGFYEMDEDEVKSYVLGSLNHIRTKQRDKDRLDFISCLLVGFLLAIGIKTFVQNEKIKFGAIYLAYFLSIFPAAWSLAVINHLNRTVVFTNLIFGSVVAALVCSIFCLAASGRSYARTSRIEMPSAIAGLLISSAVVSLFSAWTMADALLRFHRP